MQNNKIYLSKVKKKTLNRNSNDSIRINSKKFLCISQSYEFTHATFFVHAVPQRPLEIKLRN